VVGQPDIYVIGGGPAGLAAAIAARLKGFEATVADGAHPPIDKACGEGLMPDSIDALRQLGIAFDSEECCCFRGIRFIGDGGTVSADFPRKRGIAIRRTRLHRLLIARAEEVGVHLQWRTRVTSLDGIRARWIVGADGANSRVRNWAGLNAASVESRRFGFRRHYRIEPWTDFMEIYWGPRCQMYVSPVSRGETCVALLTRDSHERLEAALRHFPQLARRIAGAEPISEERGGVTVTRKLKRVYRDRVALIGDASGPVDAITGEGISLSFRQALALADAMAANDLAQYQIEHARMRRRPAFMAQLMLLLDRFPSVRPHVLRLFAAKPALFKQLLAVHAGA
jgi:menaquinone-9 beta-reductase